MKALKWILTILAISMMAFVYGSNGRKTVIAVVDEFPNYIFHVLTLGCCVPEDPEYSSLYGNVISDEDKVYLKEHKQLLEWGNGSFGVLTGWFLFFPGYINFKTEAEVYNYFNTLDEAVKNKDFAIFKNKYGSYIDDEKKMFPLDYDELFSSMFQYSDEVHQIAEIFKENYTVYDKKVWPIEKVKLQAKADALNAELLRHDFIAGWEEITGIKFKANSFQVVLYSANAKGPSANSLSYDRDAFYYNLDIESLTQFIAHEVGTHILTDTLFEVAAMGKFEYSKLYPSFENMAEFYNAKFIYKAKPFIGTQEIFDTYNSLYDKYPGISPKELLIKYCELVSKR